MDGMSKDSDNVMVRLKQEDIAQIDRISKIRGFASRSAYIRDAVEKTLNPEYITLKFIKKEMEILDNSAKNTGYDSIENFIKDASLNIGKEDKIRQLVDEKICDVLKDPSRKGDLKEIVKDLVAEEIKERFS